MLTRDLFAVANFVVFRFVYFGVHWIHTLVYFMYTESASHGRPLGDAATVQSLDPNSPPSTSTNVRE